MSSIALLTRAPRVVRWRSRSFLLHCSSVHICLTCFAGLLGGAWCWSLEQVTFHGVAHPQNFGLQVRCGIVLAQVSALDLPASVFRRKAVRRVRSPVVHWSSVVHASKVLVGTSALVVVRMCLGRHANVSPAVDDMSQRCITSIRVICYAERTYPTPLV